MNALHIPHRTITYYNGPAHQIEKRKEIRRRTLRSLKGRFRSLERTCYTYHVKQEGKISL
jgi:hypothetical protein